jgi:hypothetical protein
MISFLIVGSPLKSVSTMPGCRIRYEYGCDQPHGPSRDTSVAEKNRLITWVWPSSAFCITVG